MPLLVIAATACYCCQVMKMDVEGFELHVLRGATNLLQRYNVWYIMLECNTNMLGMQGQMEYLK
jgi:FkbM family methyltransferase